MFVRKVEMEGSIAVLRPSGDERGSRLRRSGNGNEDAGPR